jgi:hypothetical protein
MASLLIKIFQLHKLVMCVSYLNKLSSSGINKLRIGTKLHNMLLMLSVWTKIMKQLQMLSHPSISMASIGDMVMTTAWVFLSLVIP